LFPVLHRATHREISALHLAAYDAACAPWPAAQLRHTPACCVHETACADEMATNTASASPAAGVMILFTKTPSSLVDEAHPSAGNFLPLET
jgi:hypothetical protein